MPLIEVKAFERRFEDPRPPSALIAKLTDALCEVFGEEVRDETWVVLEGVEPLELGLRRQGAQVGDGRLAGSLDLADHGRRSRSSSAARACGSSSTTGAG